MYIQVFNIFVTLNSKNMNNPFYKNVQQQIKNQIISGHFKEGDLLPAENSLAEHYKITRTTIRHALDELVKEGYIKKKKGKGSIVSLPNLTLGIFRFQNLPGAAGLVNQVKLIFIKKPQLTEWDDYFFFPISEEEKEAGCIYFKRICILGDEPIMLEYTFLANLGLRGLVEKPFVNNSLLDTLNSVYTIEINSLKQELKAISADKSLSKSFNIKKGKPLIQIQQKFETNRSNLSIYSRVIYNTERFSISNSNY
jgi:DNA-binding GntR family transcriptional regulator